MGLAIQNTTRVDAFWDNPELLKGWFRALRQAEAVPETEHFVKEIVDYGSCCHQQRVLAGTAFYRARVHEFGEHHFHLPLSERDLSAPPREKACAGRVNREGEPVLYAADSAETAMAEVRPFLLASVSIGTVVPKETVIVIDARAREAASDPSFRDEEQIRTESIWAELICFFYSHPINPRDRFGYLPTQEISAGMKAAGIGGVLYSSAMRKGGHNIAFFNPAVVEIAEPKLYEVSEVRYSAIRRM